VFLLSGVGALLSGQSSGRFLSLYLLTLPFQALHTKWFLAKLLPKNAFWKNFQPTMAAVVASI
jgi:hypothetical protein